MQDSTPHSTPTTITTATRSKTGSISQTNEEADTEILSTNANSRRPSSPSVQGSISTTSSPTGTSTRNRPEFEEDDDEDDGELLDDGTEGSGPAGSTKAEDVEDVGESGGTNRAIASSTPSKRSRNINASTLVSSMNKSQAAFVHKLYSMVSLGPSALDSLICWSKDGRSFTVAQPNEFARTVLPQYFKHANFASFVRQLNMYGFHKVNDLLATAAQPNADGQLAWEFQHACFRRDDPDLLVNIKRKSSKQNPAITSVGSPAAEGRSRTPTISTGSIRRDGRTSTVSSTSSSHVNTCEGAIEARPDGREDERSLVNRYRSPSLLEVEEDMPVMRTVSGDDAVRRTGWGDTVAGMDRSHRGPSIISRGGTRSPSVITEPRRSSTTTLPSTSRVSPIAASFPPFPLGPAAPTASSSIPVSRPYTSIGINTRVEVDDNTIQRQVAVLEAQVRSLTDALAQTQQASYSIRTNAGTATRILVGVVEGLDLTREQKEQLDRCTAVLQRAESESYTAANSSTPSFAASSPSWGPWQTVAGNPQGRSPRPSSSSSSSLFQFTQRPAPPESFARGRPPGRRADSRDDSYSTESDGVPPPLAPYGRNGSGSSAGGAYNTTRPPSSGFAGSGFTHPSSTHRPGSSSSSTYANNYPSPRTSWQALGERHRSSESLPSLSSILVDGAKGGDSRARPLSRESQNREMEDGERKKPRYG